ncbi:MAG: hypothetical protein RR863_04515 [Erysipelotrichaceae bacterium]
MKLDVENARKCLPESVLVDFDNIVNQKVLGASTHIKLIGNMIEQICLEAIKSTSSVNCLCDKIKTVVDYFIQTRGEASQAIVNALLQMTQGLNCYSDTDEVKEVAHKIIATKMQYDKKAKADINKVVEYACEIANQFDHILVYDYSSTVEAMIRNLKPGKTIYIAESRIINGGFPFVKASYEAHHKIKFFSDASLMYYLKECDVAFMGVETFFPDGTGFNTTGSDIVGLICDYYKIPLYMITPMVKLDVRPLYGKRKDLVIVDLYNKLAPIANPEKLAIDIDYKTPELIGVNPAHIHAFISEYGVIPSNQMYEISRRYAKILRGEDNV